MEKDVCPNCGTIIDADEPYCPECWWTRKDEARAAEDKSTERETAENADGDEGTGTADASAEQTDEGGNEENDTSLTLGRVVSLAIQYAVGGFYFLLGIGASTYTIFSGLLFFLGMVFVLPVSRRFIEEQSGDEIPAGLVLLILTVTFFGGILLASPEQTEAQLLALL